MKLVDVDGVPILYKVIVPYNIRVWRFVAYIEYSKFVSTNLIKLYASTFVSRTSLAHFMY